MRLTIEHLWDGSPAAPDEHVTLELHADETGLHLTIDAPYHADPPPPSPPGSTPGLWNYEVVELFLYGDDGRYLELELGPHGHHLVLELHAVRVVTREVPTLDVHHEITAPRWRAEARVPAALIPAGAVRCNAHAIHGEGDARRFLSAVPSGGPRPDFHRPDVTTPIDPDLRDAIRRARP